MKIFTLLLSAFLCISVSNTQKKPFENQKSNRIEKIINYQWTFNYFPNETADKGYESPGFDDSKWPAISLPHTWNTFETTGKLYPFMHSSEESDNLYWWTGWGWYRKHFSIIREYSGKKVFVEFEGVQKYCKVWINGKFLGDHREGYGSFDFDITGYLKPGEDNVLAVAVNNKQNDQFKIPPMSVGNFDQHGGICRDVALVLKDKLYIPMQGSSTHEGGTIVTTTLVSENETVIRVQTWVKNDNKENKNCTLITSITDSINKILQIIKSSVVIEPGQLYKFDQTGKPVKNLHLRPNMTPYSYKIISEVIDGKNVVDVYTRPLGSKSALAKDTAGILTVNRVLENLKGVYDKHTDENLANTVQRSIAGEPAKIVLTGSHQKIEADRGSVAIITAGIVDSKGNQVYSAKKTIKWTVSGPATLVGPSIYESDINNDHQMDGVRYKDMPVSNVVRSTGKPGKIRITVSASGLASGSFDIEAKEIQPDNSVIIEPVLADEGRKPVARITLTVNRLEEIPREIKMTGEEFSYTISDKPVYARVIKDFILKNNPAIDSVLIEFKTLVDLLASHLLNNNGRIVADDYNFNVDHYNNCRLISGYINSTKLPALFKEGLKRYYAEAIILQGSEKNAGEEMNWLNWIPSGGTVVIVQNENTKINLKGVIFTRQTGLTEIISAVYPQFVNFSDEAKERALIFISKMNPYVHVTSGSKQSMEGDKNIITNISSYTAEKGQPILIPALKFISE